MQNGLYLPDLLIWQDNYLVFLKRAEKLVTLLFVILELIVDERRLCIFLILDGF